MGAKGEYEVVWTYHKDLEMGLRHAGKQDNALYTIFNNPPGILKKRRIVYVGMSTGNLLARLLNKHGGLQSAIAEVDGRTSIAVGVIGGVSSISESRLKAVESLLIAHFKPMLNAQGVKGYKGPKISVDSSTLLPQDGATRDTCPSMLNAELSWDDY